ncbi:serine hydrolase domain-containing protein [Cupriavidus basilensis]
MLNPIRPVALAAVAAAILPAAAWATDGNAKTIREANLDVPSANAIMVGSPPEPANMVTPENRLSPRFMRWSMTHASTNFNVVRVPRGQHPVSSLPAGEALDVDALTLTDADNAPIRMQEFYRKTGTDGFLVLHRGQVVFERYLGDMKPTTIHAINSCTKSFVGTLTTMLAQEGKLDLAAPASRYVPELARSAIGSATVQQLLDMRANFTYGGKPHQIGTLQADALQALGFLPRPAGYHGPNGIYELLLSAQPAGEHGVGPFRYDNGSTDALGWILRRVSGKSVAQLVAERFWDPLGADQDAEMTLDASKTEWAAGGLNTNLRDLARFGEMMRLDGRFNGRTIVPEEVVASIRKGGDRTAFKVKSIPGGSYHDQWWFTHDEYDSYNCRGQFGQRVWIAPRGETVIVQLSTDPDTSGSLEPLRLLHLSCHCEGTAGAPTRLAN